MKPISPLALKRTSDDLRHLNHPFYPDDALTVATRFGMLIFVVFLRRCLPQDAPHHFAAGRKAWTSGNTPYSQNKSAQKWFSNELVSWHFPLLFRAKTLFMLKNGRLWNTISRWTRRTPLWADDSTVSNIVFPASQGLHTTPPSVILALPPVGQPSTVPRHDAGLCNLSK